MIAVRVGPVAVFLRNIIVVLARLEIFVRLGLQHLVDQLRETLGLGRKELQRIDHLARREEVVLIKLFLHRVGVLAHIGRQDVPVGLIAAEVVPHALGDVVVGIHDRRVQAVFVAIAADEGVPADLAVMYLFGEDHVDRHLVHAAGDHILVGVVIVLLARDGVAPAAGDGFGGGVVLGEELVDDLLPAPAGKARVILFALGHGGGSERQQQREHQQQSQDLSPVFHHVCFHLNTVESRYRRKASSSSTVLK